MSNKTKAVLVGLILIAVGPFLTFTGHKEKTRLAQLEKDGATVEGYITGGESKSGRRRGTSYTFNVEFKTADGKAISRDFNMKSDFAKAHISGDSISDPNVKVRYLPADPDNAIIVGGSSDDALMFPIGIGLFVVGLGVTVYGFKFAA